MAAHELTGLFGGGPTDEAPAERTCAWCGASLEGMRADAKYDNSSCRGQATFARQRSEALWGWVAERKARVQRLARPRAGRGGRRR